MPEALTDLSLGAGLVCVALALLIVFAVVGTRGGWHPILAARAYRILAAERGLHLDTRGLAVHGHIGDRAVWIGEVAVGHGPERRRQILATVGFRRPLGLGFRIRRKGRGSRKRTQIPIPHKRLARRIEVACDDPERATQLLGGPVLDALLAISSRWPDLQVDDTRVRLRLRRAEAGPDRLRDLLASLEGLASAIESARLGLGPMVPLDTWRAAAERLGLTLEEGLPALSGQLNGHSVVACAMRDGVRIVVDVRVRRAGPRLGLSLSLQPMDVPPSLLGQDIPMGDAAFDQAFVVKGWDPGRVRDAVGPEARSRLIALSQRATLRVDDDVVTAQFPCLDLADDLLEVLGCAVALDGGR